MKNIVRIIAFMMMLALFCPVALAAKATPTPPPIDIASTLAEPPAEIRKMLDVAYDEWKTLGGEKLPNVNKFTEWRGKGYKFEWCAGYITWVMMEAGIPMEELADIRAHANDNDIWHVDGLYHCKEASPGKLLRAYQVMERATMVPQKGFIVIYGCSYNKVIHAGFVYDVEDLGGGKYRLTTLEGNIGDSIEMFVRDYDMNAQVNTNSKKSTNLTVVPEDKREAAESSMLSYEIMSGKPSSSTSGKYMYYVNRFLMPWVPGDPALSTPEPTAVPTPAPTATPVPTATPAPTPEATEAPVVAEVIALNGPPAPTEAPVVTEAPTAAPTAEPAAEATAEPTAAPTAEPTPEPTPEADPTWACQGKDGACPYITRDENTPFCRACDRNKNGVEDSKE